MSADTTTDHVPSDPACVEFHPDLLTPESRGKMCPVCVPVSGCTCEVIVDPDGQINLAPDLACPVHRG